MNLGKIKREILKTKRNLRKKILKQDEEASSLQRVYGEKTKTIRALKVEMFDSKSKKSNTQGDETKIEEFIRKILESNFIKFKEQKALRYLNYDFYLMDYDLFVEVNGDYWHCSPRMYPNGPKNDIQRRNLEKNKNKRTLCEECKTNLLEIWEQDIKNNPQIVEKKFLQLIKSLSEKPKREEYRFFSSENWHE
jgi:G:T-mismatch repair DNA endonuclease (very short patch repair protein)